jgi:tetrapyrrole methylase family protein/MazG family protein
MSSEEAGKGFGEFVTIIKALRTPVTGCPWDLEQTHQTLRPYLVEEAHEVLDAIDHGNDDALQEELGDLMLQVVLHAQLAADRGAFTIADVIAGIAAKMVRRHPHVFGSVQVSGSAEVVRNWEEIKAAEKGQAESSLAAALARVPASLPALLRAQRLGEKAAKVQGGDGSTTAALERVRQDFAGLETTLAEGGPAIPDDLRARLDRGFGELLFGLCQLANCLCLNAEDSLRAAVKRFVAALDPDKPSV